MVHLAAELGLADHLAAGALTADDLALRTKTHAACQGGNATARARHVAAETLAECMLPSMFLPLTNVGVERVVASAFAHDLIRQRH
jgi:hypothetical protein